MRGLESRPAPPVLLSKAHGLRDALRSSGSDPVRLRWHLFECGHSRILVGKLVCDLFNLTQLIRGQQKTEPMTQTIFSNTKCKFPHPTNHFKFTFDRNTYNSSILFVSICSTQATVLAERDNRRAANIINLISAFELEQNNYESPSAPLWCYLSHLRNHQSWSWHCSQLCLCTFPHVPFSTHHAQFLNSNV